jgi:hypothetical protein
LQRASSRRRRNCSMLPGSWHPFARRCSSATWPRCSTLRVSGVRRSSSRSRWISCADGKRERRQREADSRALGQKGHSQCNRNRHVRFGSKADICAAKRQVRFTLESGHRLHDFTVASSHRAKSKTHRLRRRRLFRIRESSKAYGVDPTGRPGIQICHGSAHHNYRTARLRTDSKRSCRTNRGRSTLHRIHNSKWPDLRGREHSLYKRNECLHS